jgi:SNF2 family DNA or RNA helicase
MTEQQQDLYDQMAKEALIMWGSRAIAVDVKIAQITRLRQLVTDPGALLEGYTGGSGKLDKLVEEVREAPGKVVVFSQFAEIIERASKVLTEAGFKTVTLTGRKNRKQRDAAVEQLQKGDARVLLATIKTGGEGLTLTAASKVVFLDPAWNPAGLQQAEDRIYRIGQLADLVETVILRTSNSIDDFMWDVIARKDQVSMDDVLAYLKEHNA